MLFRSVASCHGGSPVAEPLLERRYSNKRVKRSADVPESTDGTIRRKNSVMNGGWFSQRGRERPSKPKPVLERVESDIVPIQSTPPLQLQPPEISQPTPASTSAPQTPSLRHPNNTTPVISGPHVEPVAIPLKVITNSNDAPFGSLTFTSSRSLSASRGTRATVFRYIRPGFGTRSYGP